MGKSWFNGNLGPRPNTYDLARLFAAAADEARAGYVSCPACGGSGRRKGVDKGHYRADLDSEICSGCHGAGDVAARRVCDRCNEFRSCCPCGKTSR